MRTILLNTYLKKACFSILLLLITGFAFAQSHVVSVAGQWSYRLDPQDQGVSKQWYKVSLGKHIILPGTLDDAGVGDAVAVDTTRLNKEVMLHLTRRHRYIGPVWYQKTVRLNKGMGNASLLLERVIWKTDCWIDGAPVDPQESLIAPQNFMLGKLSAGNHVITLRIDSRKQHDISFNDFAHAYTDGTQIMWNGVIGRMELRNAAAGLKTIKVNASLSAKEVSADIELTSVGAQKLYMQSFIVLGGKQIAKTARATIGDEMSQQIKLKVPQCLPWDEFNTNVYTWKTVLTDASGKVVDTRTEHFGFRNLASVQNALQINGRPLFLRGTLECNIFPIEGHPPMEAAGWVKVFSAAKQYGLNHLRFHSWCPPEAAFRVADSLGFYLHVELPLWSLNVGKDKPTLTYLEDEAQRIIDNYGNHPSFCFWSMGNELEGDFDWLQALVAKLKKQDNRHLYTTTTFSFQRGHGRVPEPIDDYFITQYTNKGWVRGQGIFNTNPPDFKTDYSKAVAGLTVPLIIHEVGQYSVYPDLKEIARYKGVLEPANFNAVHNDLRKKNMLNLAAPYLKNSGILSANLYKEEIERALKTQGISGFQLLDLHDFPGQGTALVGILNAFWETKGIIAPETFRQFCSPVVPLLRFDKAAYTGNETFTASAEVANYSSKAINDEVSWTVATRDMNVLFQGNMGTKLLPIGNSQTLGSINIPLNTIKQAEELTVSLFLKNGKQRNEWKIWIYPETKPVILAGAVFTTSADSALTLLKQGHKVVFNPDTSAIKGIDGRFAPVFWSPVHFPDQPGSMGLLIDDQHPALANFPTETYSNWQWWDLVTNSRSVVLDDLNAQPTPIVRVIDNFFRNRNLAVLTEFSMGKGKLLLCTMDMHHDLAHRPAARQLKSSLLQYAGSAKFNPNQPITENQLLQMIKNQ